jgi:D-glycero-D-manno-heptose 1,7-bisphosphate phosphatase
LAAKAVFLDRDGVINEKAPGDGYITAWKDLRILPGVPEAISLFNRAGFQVIVATNQRCVAKGLISLPELDALHLRMRQELWRSEARINAIYFCPHDTTAACECRKPAPGMLLQAAREYGIDLENSWMIGDSELDVNAGIRAGCKTALVGVNQVPSTGLGGKLRAETLLQAALQIIKSQ